MYLSNHAVLTVLNLSRNSIVISKSIFVQYGFIQGASQPIEQLMQLFWGISAHEGIGIPDRFIVLVMDFYKAEVIIPTIL
jgi:hypothetical protein